MFGDAYELRLGTILAMYIVLACAWDLIGGMADIHHLPAAFFGPGPTPGHYASQGADGRRTFAAIVAAAVAFAIG